MITTPNQRVILVRRESTKDATNFLAIKKENLERALYELTGSEFKLYIMIAANKDGYEFAFSPQYYHNVTGMHENTVRKTLNSLMDKGYIVQSKTSKNKLVFYEVPQVVKPTFQLPTLYVYAFDGSETRYFSRDEIFAGNDEAAALEFWNSQQKYVMDENGDYKPFHN